MPAAILNIVPSKTEAGMRRRKREKRRILLYVIGELLILLVVAQIALYLFLDTEAYKREVERVASEALDMEVTLNGGLSVELLPGLHVAMRDVHIRNRGTDLVSVPHARFGIELLPLLRKEVRIETVRLRNPTIHIERDRNGRYNFERQRERMGGAIPAFDVSRISLADATVVYVAQQSGGRFDALGCNLNTPRLQFPGGPGTELLNRLAVTAQLTCREVRRGNLVASGLKLSLSGKDGVFDFKPITMHLLDGQGSGSVRVDLSRPMSVIDVHYALPQFRVDGLFKEMASKHAAAGTLDLTVHLSFQGKGADALKRSAAGEVSIRGANLRLVGTDLDKALARYESSQSFNLVDAGAFFFAGPVGLVATKGFNFASIAQAASGDTHITKVVSDWKVRDSAAHAQDVALATRENRVALRGRVDFINERFDDIMIAVIDAKGCTSLQQTVRGPFQRPTLDRPGVLASLAGPAIRLLKTVTGRRCEVFYAGAVAAPE